MFLLRVVDRHGDNLSNKRNKGTSRNERNIRWGKELRAIQKLTE
ncbi:hypothetical protein HMPREF1861_02227 [Corynebacterium kroppenstedtii]|nr:hypothetical protein HMPREF1861_02227 [Corynebacterium kroppenstedtii]